MKRQATLLHNLFTILFLTIFHVPMFSRSEIPEHLAALCDLGNDHALVSPQEVITVDIDIDIEWSLVEQGIPAITSIANYPPYQGSWSNSKSGNRFYITAEPTSSLAGFYTAFKNIPDNLKEFTKSAQERKQNWDNEQFASYLNYHHYKEPFAKPQKIEKNWKIFQQYNLYQFDGFRGFVNSLVGYDDFILSLEKKINKGGNFAKSLRYIQGFDNEFKWRYLPIHSHKDRYGFHEWVRERAESIRNRHNRKVQANQQKSEKQEIHQAQQELKEKQKEEIATAAQTVKELICHEAEAKGVLEAYEDERSEIELIRSMRYDLEQRSLEGIRERDSQLIEHGKQFLHEAEAFLEAGDDDQYVKRMVRAQATIKTLNDKGKTTRKKFSLAYDSCDLMRKEQLSINDYTSFSGNDLQLLIHQEMVITLNELPQLTEREPGNSYTQTISNFALRIIDGARNYNSERAIEHACAYQDLSENLIELGHKFLDVLSHSAQKLNRIFVGAFELTYRGAAITASGLQRGIGNFSNNCKEIADKVASDPIGAAKDYAQSIAKTSYTIGKIILMICTDPQGSYTVGKNLATKVKKMVQETPSAELAEGTIAFITEMILTRGLRGFASNEVIKFADKSKALARYITTETKVASIVSEGKKTIKQSLAPVTEAFKGAKKVADTGFKEGLEITKKAIDEFQHNPIVMSLNPSGKQLVKLYKGWTNEGVCHVFRPWWRTYEEAKRLGKDPGIRSGLHTFDSFERMMKECQLNPANLSIETLKNGVARIIFPKGTGFCGEKYRKRAITYLVDGTKIQGIKTLWPKNYTFWDIVNSAEDIRSKPINKIKGNLLEGITQKNIKALIRINKENKIVSAYPSWDQ